MKERKKLKETERQKKLTERKKETERQKKLKERKKERKNIHSLPPYKYK